METHVLYPIIVLRVNINCCKDCPETLKKALWSINGVYSVAVDPEKKLVYVAGKVDPKLLLDSIAKMGKSAEILSCEEGANKDKRQAYDDHFFNRGQNYHYHGKEDYNFRRTGMEQKQSGKKEGDDDHEFEDYVPPKFDPHLCRDPFCKLHNRRPIFHEKVPAWNSPHHSARFFHGASPMFYHGSHLDDYYSHPGMSQPGYGGYGSHGDDSGCTIM
nr:uncharacterized protein LOC113743453 [Coffea arabica]